MKIRFHPKEKLVRVILVLSAVILLQLGQVMSTRAIGFEVIKPHRAVYDIKLLKSSERSGIRRMEGRMVFEVRGNECDGITLKYRFLTKVSTARDQYLSDQHTSTFETADGREFTFLSKSFLNEQLETTTKGVAKHTSKGISVALESPVQKDVNFSNAQFLTSYLVKLIELAKSGEHFMRDDLYDGSEGGDKIISTSTVISKLKSVADSKDEFGGSVSGHLKDIDAWHVSMSYFDKHIGASAEHTPMFESSFLLFANGVSSDMVMQYPDYTLSGTLSELEMFKEESCARDG